MAEEVIAKVGIDTGDSDKKLENVKDGIDDIGKATDNAKKGTKSLAGGFKVVGTAIKAAGIGLVIGALALLKDAFSKNQKVVDTFNTVFEATSIALNDFVNYVVNNFGKVTGFFKDVFENPQEKLKQFGKAIQDNLIERFNSFLDTLGFVAQAVKQVFEGDFAGALDSAKQAGKEYVDVLTGVDGTVDKVSNTVKNVTKSVTEYAKATYESAAANIELEKSSKVAQAQLKGVLESYDRQAEILRQQRDDETLTFEQRIEANEKLKEVLDDQEKAMLKLAQVEVDRAQAQFDKLANDENEIALIQAKNELAGIEAQITGFRSEQLQNQNALEKELGETKRQLALESVEEREREILEVEQQYEELFRLAEKSGVDTTALEKKKAQDITKIKETHAKEDAEIRKAVEQSELDTAQQITGQVKSLFGEQSAAGKIAGIADATINTYVGASKAIAQGGVAGPILAALTIASGLKTVASIASTPTPEFAQGGIVSGFGTGTSDSVSASLSRGESVINAKSTRMFKPLLSTINEAGGGRAFAGNEGSGGQSQGVIKAFVVADDMTNEQDKLTNIRRKATI